MPDSGLPGTPPGSRCTDRKHVAERGKTFCDCGALMLGMTAAGNARVVTVMDPVQRWALGVMGEDRSVLDGAGDE